MIPCTFRAIEELQPGAKWQAVFEEAWPAYERWFLKEGEDARASYATSVRMLRSYMPELVPVHERFVALAGGDDLAARLLTLYKPPAYIAFCSQGAVTKDTPVLVRNYDYTPALFEGVILSTKLGDRRVIGTSDCLWGLLDGMNDAGRLRRSRSADAASSATASGSRWSSATSSRPARRWGSESRPVAPAVSHGAQPDDARSHGEGGHGLRLAGSRAGVPRCSGRHEPPGEGGVGGTGEGDEDGRTRTAHPGAPGGPGPHHRRLRARVPSAAAAQQGLRPGDGDDLHGRVLAHGGAGRVPLARPHVAAVIRRVRRGIDTAILRTDDGRPR